MNTIKAEMLPNINETADGTSVQIVDHLGAVHNTYTAHRGEWMLTRRSDAAAAAARKLALKEIYG